MDGGHRVLAAQPVAHLNSQKCFPASFWGILWVRNTQGLVAYTEQFSPSRITEQPAVTQKDLRANRGWKAEETPKTRRTPRQRCKSSKWKEGSSEPILPPTPHPATSLLPRQLGDMTHSPWNSAQSPQQLCPEGHQIQVLAAGEPLVSQLLPWGTFSTQERNAKIEFLSARTRPQLPKTDSQVHTYHTEGFAFYPTNTLPHSFWV